MSMSTHTKFPSRFRDASPFISFSISHHRDPRDCTGMADGKRLDSSIDILKRHYPRVASLQDYIHSVISNATEVALVVPDDPEEYRDLLENSKVGHHQPPCQNYRARPSMFEIDEVDGSYTISACHLQAVRSSKDHSGASSAFRVLQKMSLPLATRYARLDVPRQLP